MLYTTLSVYNPRPQDILLPSRRIRGGNVSGFVVPRSRHGTENDLTIIDVELWGGIILCKTEVINVCIHDTLIKAACWQPSSIWEGR